MIAIKRGVGDISAQELLDYPVGTVMFANFDWEYRRGDETLLSRKVGEDAWDYFSVTMPPLTQIVWHKDDNQREREVSFIRKSREFAQGVPSCEHLSRMCSPGYRAMGWDKHMPAPETVHVVPPRHIAPNHLTLAMLWPEKAYPLLCRWISVAYAGKVEVADSREAASRLLCQAAKAGAVLSVRGDFITHTPPWIVDANNTSVSLEAWVAERQREAISERFRKAWWG